MIINLSPYEADRIIADNFALTEMGRDLLAQDYLLKQITSSLIYPEGEVGKKFWKKVYQLAFDKYGTTDIPLDTFNKVWIVPDKALVYEKHDTAMAINSHLQVMLESDYFALARSQGEARQENATQKETQELSRLVVREIVIPALEQEVNEGENFAILRQVYSAMLLATWFKKALRKSLLGQVYADKSKTAGVQLNDPEAKEKIYKQYLQAYKKGVFNLIKEEQDPVTQQVIPRKYFSGGTKAFDEGMITEAAESEAQSFSASHGDDLDSVTTQLTSNLSDIAVSEAFGFGRSDRGARFRSSGRQGQSVRTATAAPLKSQKEYNRDVARKEEYLREKDIVDRFIAPGKEDYAKFKPLYDEVRGIVDRLLIARGLNPQEFQFLISDTSVVRLK
ncbi:MAG: hypothetical protein HQL20_11170 [Candidatus Omnitrophica bacterium]|nr:hypothetical protein [Candidatus Omnitrophota bacterium]